MANGGKSSNNFLYFLVGGLIVAVAVLGYLYYQGEDSGGDINLKIETPSGENSEK